jgi:hypothetical protein
MSDRTLTPRRRRSRRLSALLIGCVAIGGLAQLPLAWACAIAGRSTTPGWTMVQLLRPASVRSDTEVISVGSIRHMGVRAVSVEAQPPTPISRRYLEHHTFEPDSPEVRFACAPWSPRELHPALVDSSAWPARTGVYSRPNLIHTEPLAFRIAAGWPYPCVEGRIEYDNANRAYRYVGILTDPKLLPPPTSETGYLCYLPRWRYLLANALIDGGLLAAVCLVGSLTARAIVARSRRRRTLCPKCAYDLRHTPVGSPCPECGTPRDSGGMLSR